MRYLKGQDAGYPGTTSAVNFHRIYCWGGHMSAESFLSQCEIVLVRNLEDVMGYPCGKDSTETCEECGTTICGLHAESCDLCSASVCGSCFLSHMREPHAKPVVPSSTKELKRRTA